MPLGTCKISHSVRARKVDLPGVSCMGLAGNFHTDHIGSYAILALCITYHGEHHPFYRVQGWLLRG